MYWGYCIISVSFFISSVLGKHSYGFIYAVVWDAAEVEAVWN